MDSYFSAFEMKRILFYCYHFVVRMPNAPDCARVAKMQLDRTKLTHTRARSLTCPYITGRKR